MNIVLSESGVTSVIDGAKPHVRFEIEQQEDKKASKQRGIYVPKDVVMVTITPPGSVNNFKEPVDSWKVRLEDEVRMGYTPPQWRDEYLKQLEAFMNGQELPVNGIPIKGWSAISPAQQKMLIDRNVLTVEALAAANDDLIRAIGMGGVMLKQRAQSWLDAADKGKVVAEITEAKQENAQLKSEVEALKRMVADLKQMIPVAEPKDNGKPPKADDDDDILPRKGRR